MCGIAGFINFKTDLSEVQLAELSKKMGEAISYRGPDSWGSWQDQQKGVALCHRRLAIIDLSDAGAQPMISQSGRYVMVYNGEIYNHQILRARLQSKSVIFKGTSDSETILEHISHFGIDATIEKSVGMFAIALWDRKEQELTLIRDRMGIKPLYYSKTSRGFIFASELKAMRQHPDFSTDINRNAIANYLRHNYIPSPNSIYNGTFKLPQGHILTMKIGEDVKIKKFWDLDSVVAKGQAEPLKGTDKDAIDGLHDLLKDAVTCRMMADVPLGAFLSGGIDSSLVTAIMQAQSTARVKTFSIGFNEEGYNEANHAKAVAEHLGTNHTELYVTEKEATGVIPILAKIYDEPFSDSSQIPTYLVSKMTKEHVTVALSGDGGDELFAGYTRYLTAEKYGNIISNQPNFLKNIGQSVIHSLSPQTWDKIGKLLPNPVRPTHLGERMHKLANVLTEDKDNYYRNLISHWQLPNDIVIGGVEDKGIIWDDNIKNIVPNFINRMQYLDMQTYLPDDILTKVDKASMAVSLEARVPLIDHRVVEYSWALPNHFKIREGQSKWILRQILYQYLPKNLIDRPKMGFGVPIDKWLRQELRDWAEYLLSEEMFKKHGLLHRAPVMQKWREHLSGGHNWQYYIWDILMLHAWAEEYHA